MSVTLTLLELAAIVGGAVVLAVTDGAAISRLGIAWTAKRLGIKPRDVVRYDRATDGQQEGAE